MPYGALKIVHIILAILLAVYSLMVFYLDARFSKLAPGTTEYAAANRRFKFYHRLANYDALLVFLIGGAIGASFFTSGHLWIYGKLLLFIALLGVMGALGNKALKMRHDANSAAQPEELLRGAAAKMKIFKITQIILLALIFYIALVKPF